MRSLYVVLAYSLNLNTVFFPQKALSNFLEDTILDPLCYFITEGAKCKLILEALFGD